MRSANESHDENENEDVDEVSMCIYLLQLCQCYLQGLLDEDDSGVEGGDPDSKVLLCVSCILCFMCIFQTGDGDRGITVTEEAAPVKDTKDSKVVVSVSVLYLVCMLFLQGEKCFCAKGDKCPSIGEAASSDRDSGEKAKVCIVLVQ